MIKYDTKKINEIPISSVVSRFSSLLTKGCSKSTLCPWHEDHSPSLILYEKSNQNHCYCFVCRRKGNVIDYVMQAGNLSFKDACQWLCQEYGIPTIGGKEQSPYVPEKKITPTPPAAPDYSYIPWEYMQQTLSTRSNFCKGLLQIFPADRVEHVASEYCLGLHEDYSLSGDVIFWHIDRNMRVCNGKVQRYCDDITSPRFLHCEHNVLYWLGKKLHAKGIVKGEPIFNSKCLFGEHLLNQYPTATVVLVESAKNAIVGACQYPDLLWVATGCSGALTCETLQVLARRKVIVYPDRDAIADWTKTIDKMRDIANFTISPFCENVATDDEPKYDVADYIIAQRLAQIM